MASANASIVPLRLSGESLSRRGITRNFNEKLGAFRYIMALNASANRRRRRGRERGFLVLALMAHNQEGETVAVSRAELVIP